MAKFNVVNCFSCHMFQVDQAKKAQKWKCKVCGEKQSFTKILFESDLAKDCRVAVQELNMKKATEPIYIFEDSPLEVTEPLTLKLTGPPKWNEFISEEDFDVPGKKEISGSQRTKAPDEYLFSLLDKGLGLPPATIKPKVPSAPKAIKRAYASAISDMDTFVSLPSVSPPRENYRSDKIPCLYDSLAIARIPDAASKPLDKNRFKSSSGQPCLPKFPNPKPIESSRWSKFADLNNAEAENENFDSVSLW